MKNLTPKQQSKHLDTLKENLCRNPQMTTSMRESTCYFDANGTLSTLKEPDFEKMSGFESGIFEDLPNKWVDPSTGAQIDLQPEDGDGIYIVVSKKNRPDAQFTFRNDRNNLKSTVQ